MGSGSRSQHLQVFFWSRESLPVNKAKSWHVPACARRMPVSLGFLELSQRSICLLSPVLRLG